ncbi:recombinase family protein [Hymenobacter terricola]|uniref:recombinase family protein n=1 Tax=Hymenobacter terricola TaxID=2819236 RepID=UPI001B309EB8|nr:recombinase family protein [Hymenobacter terricola]
MRTAVLFVRVTKKEQHYQRQVEDLGAVAQSQAVQVVAEISEQMSGGRRNAGPGGDSAVVGVEPARSHSE